MTSAALVTLPSTSSGTTSEIPKKADVDARLTTIQTALNTLNAAVSKLIGGDDRLVSGCVGAGALGTDIRALLGGMVYLEQARLVATANRALSGLTAIDGVTPVANDRILLVGQSDTTQNGVWEAASGAWTRPADFTGIISEKTTVYVSSGVVYSGRTWCWFAGGTVGSSAQTWSPIWGLGGRGMIFRAGVVGPVTLASGAWTTMPFGTPTVDIFGMWNAGHPTNVDIPVGAGVSAQLWLDFGTAVATSQQCGIRLYSTISGFDPELRIPCLDGVDDRFGYHWQFPASAATWVLSPKALQLDSGANARNLVGGTLEIFLDHIQ